MPSSDAPEIIVARFLKSNNYRETLDAFLKEAGLPSDTGATSAGDWTIEKILEEKKQYDASIVYEKVSEQEKNQGWSLPAPTKSHPITSLGSPSNILAVHVNTSQAPWDSTQNSTSPSQLLVSSADRKISVISTERRHELLDTIDVSLTHNSPVLSINAISQNVFMTSSMSGHVDLYGAGHRRLDSGRHHIKYAVQVIFTRSIHDSQQGRPICIAASAGWDQKICIYAFEPPSDQDISDENTTVHSDIQPMGQPVATISVVTNPESVVFVRHPDDNKLYLVLGRRDSTYLYYYKLIEEMSVYSPSTLSVNVQEAGRQNLAPHANAWISFSPSSLASCPRDPTLVAVGTSHLPHMKLILVRLLFPSTREQTGGASGAAAASYVHGETQASQARAELAIQDREDAAIVLHVSTMAPQTPYSTPQVVWRPDGTGVWVNGDDGVVRGIEAKTGKVVASLRGHEVGSKVRSLWAGMVEIRSGGGEDETEEEEEGGREEEWVVSGGFDKQVIVWKVGEEDSTM